MNRGEAAIDRAASRVLGIKFKHSSAVGLIDPNSVTELAKGSRMKFATWIAATDSPSIIRRSAARGDKTVDPPSATGPVHRSPPRESRQLLRRSRARGSRGGNYLRVPTTIRELQACALILHEIDSTCRHVFTVRYDHVRRAVSTCTYVTYALILYSYGSHSV